MHDLNLIRLPHSVIWFLNFPISHVWERIKKRILLNACVITDYRWNNRKTFIIQTKKVQKMASKKLTVELHWAVWFKLYWTQNIEKSCNFSSKKKDLSFQNFEKNAGSKLHGMLILVCATMVLILDSNSNHTLRKCEG